MDETWASRLVAGLVALDQRESPHGLYGLREARKTALWLPSLAQALKTDDERDLFRNVGCPAVGGNAREDELLIAPGAGLVHLRIISYASTKVRHFGSAYQLDKHHGKKGGEPPWDLESLVPGLQKKPVWMRPINCSALLLVAHTKTARELPKLLRRSIEPSFLDRYRVHLVKEEWPDRYGRGFYTAVALWWTAGDSQSGATTPN